jgi:protein gp37
VRTEARRLSAARPAVARRNKNRDLSFPGEGWPLANVWIGTSIEDDSYCWRADELRTIPAAIRCVV